MFFVPVSHNAFLRCIAADRCEGARTYSLLFSYPTSFSTNLHPTFGNRDSICTRAQNPRSYYLGLKMERFPRLHNRESASLHSPSRSSANSLPWVPKTLLPSVINSSSYALPITQPTSAIPLTTTFTPPASCLEEYLTQLPPPGYLIWANEPIPAANKTIPACYPAEFLKGYKSASSGMVGSSVVPLLSPLVCPSNFCTMFAGENNYVACCPSGYQFHRPDTTVDPDRPGYGGTCYSDFAVSSTYTVTAYNTNGSSNIAIWTASTSGAQAYAHPIDGFALSKPTLGCFTPLPSLNPTTLPSPTKMPRATVVGATVGALAALACLFTAILILLRLLHKRRKPPPLIIEHVSHDNAQRSCPRMYEKEGDMGFIAEKVGHLSSEVNAGRGHFEMSGETVAELDAGNDVIMANGKGVSKIFNKEGAESLA